MKTYSLLSKRPRHVTSKRPGIQSPDVQASRAQVPRAITSSCPDSKRPVVLSPTVQIPSVQRPSARLYREQASRVQASKRPEFKRPKSKPSESECPGVQSLRVPTVHPRTIFSRILFGNNFWNCYWDELQSFRGSSHHWAYNHADVYCVIAVHHQNMKVSVSLNISFFCFEKLLLTWTSEFLGKQPPMRLNYVDPFETFQQSIFQRSILFVKESSFKVEVIE